MLSRLRRFRFGLPVLIVGGLAAAYLLAGWFAVGPLIRWALPKTMADRSGYRLQVEQARFDPLRLSVDLRGLALDEPAGKRLLTMARLFVDFEAVSLFKRTYTFDQVRLERPVAEVELMADGRLNWLGFIDAIAGQKDPAADASAGPPPRLLVRHFALDKGRVDFTDHTVPGTFKTELDPLDLELDELSTLPDDKGRYAVSAHTNIGADVRWQGTFGLNPIVAGGEFALDNLELARLWPYLQRTVHTAPAAGKAALKLSYQAGYANRRFSLQLDRLGAKVDGLALHGVGDAQPAVAIDSLALEGGHIDLGTRQARLESVAVRGAKVSLVRAADGRIDLQDWFAAGEPAAASAAAASAPTAPPQPWHLSLGRASVEGMALRYVDRGFVQPLAAEAADLRLAFQADVTAGAGAPEVDVQGLNVAISDITLRSGREAAPWFQLGRVELQDGHAKLAGHELGAARVALSEGSLTAARDAQGRIALLSAFDRSASAPAQPGDGAAPWHYRIGKVEAAKFKAALREESVSPAATFTLEDIHAQADNLSDAPNVGVPVRVGLSVKSGGRLEAGGSVVPGTQAADLRLKVQGLALEPMKPYLAQIADLTLVRGQAEGDGRLRYANGQIRYEGAFALRDLLIDQPGSNDHFLSWKSLSCQRLVATQQKLDVPEIEVAGLASKLVIFKDRTINVAQVFHRQADADKTPAPPVAAQPAYQVDVGRVRVVDGEMDFADLSLTLPFAARIHSLQGQLEGLSTQRGRPAQIGLAGQVDEYGVARATGRLDLTDPTDAMDIKVIFQNVEMTSLTPYSATFAGRRIASGKLSLDLDYKLDKRQLKGENKIVMDKLMLGERVESPSAVNLPLDLALAILKDSDGRIELGLPVSGSLDDPQFSYGGIIWKAITSVIARVVSAPFRAIGALFGGGGNNEQAPEVAFDAGATQLQPPQRERLDDLAKALTQRPGLALRVGASYDPRADAAALKQARLRRAVAQQMGRELATGEDPGPISTAQPQVQQALEALYAKRFGADALETLRRQHRQANAQPAEGSASAPPPRLANLFKAREEPLAADVVARLKSADLPTLLLQRLQDEEPLADEQLAALGRDRAQAIRDRVVSRGIAAERIVLETPSAREGGAAGVPTKLDLAVAQTDGPK